MSTWAKLSDEDIEVDNDCQEVNLLISSDDFGNNYTTMTFKQVYDLYHKIFAEEV